MVAEIDDARKSGDTLGGVVEVVAYGLPPGLGSHVHWDRRLDARLAGALMGIQAIKGVEVGDGLETARRRGSVAHDEIELRRRAGVSRRTDRAGGIEGGMTNGEVLRVRAAMKPISTVPRALATIDTATGEPAVAINQRSDACAVPRGSVVDEAMVALVLADAVAGEVRRRLGRRDPAQRAGLPRRAASLTGDRPRRSSLVGPPASGKTDGRARRSRTARAGVPGHRRRRRGRAGTHDRRPVRRARASRTSARWRSARSPGRWPSTRACWPSAAVRSPARPPGSCWSPTAGRRRGRLAGRRPASAAKRVGLSRDRPLLRGQPTGHAAHHARGRAPRCTPRSPR